MNRHAQIAALSVITILGFANTACEMNIASNNQINGNQLLSNNLSPGQQNGLAGGGGGGNPLFPAGVQTNPQGLPYLPASVQTNMAAEQRRVGNVISTMAVQNNPFAHVAEEANAGRPSTVVASYQPASAAPAAAAPRAPASSTPPVAYQAPPPRAPVYTGGGGTAFR